MQVSNYAPKKNKITLSDYSYQRDIENRLFMSELSVLEVDVLIEIINGSLKTVIEHLAEDLEMSISKLKPILDKLAASNLFQIKGELLLVDKEMRKYYETQIVKFDDDFEPDMEYLQSLLTKVPISALPLWYAIPRSSDHIFNSLIEKFFLTPKTYERYLQEIIFEDPIQAEIMKEVFLSPNLKIHSKELIQKLNLTREKFEEHMLFLEFSFACCISYLKTDEIWEEVVSPYHEWREYLLFLKNNSPSSIQDVQSIQKTYPEEFGYLKQLNSFIKSIMKNPINKKDAASDLAEVTELLKLIDIENNQIKATTHANEWLTKSYPDQAIALYRQTLNHILLDDSCFSEKDFRETEKSLKRVIGSGWVYFEEFVKGCVGAIGNASPVYLKNKGKRWNYNIPQYHPNEHQFIKTVIFKYLMEAGMIETGIHQNKPCFCLTAFGKMALGD